MTTGAVRRLQLIPRLDLKREVFDDVPAQSTARAPLTNVSDLSLSRIAGLSPDAPIGISKTHGWRLRVFIPGFGRKTVKSVVSEGAPACQTVYARDGAKAFSGEWDPRVILNVLSAGDSAFWSGKSVLDLGANTGGLSVEIARLGARVTLTEPDPYKNTLQRSLDTVRNIVADEKLELDIQQLDLIQARRLPAHDVILCLGLLYHFKYPQYIIDTLSWMKPTFLFLSCQTHPSDDIAMYNRRHPGIMARNHFDRVKYPLSGWHPTRSALKLMLEAGGFGEIVDLTDKRYDFPRKMPGLTNTTYYRARCLAPKDPEVERAEFYPR